MYYSNCNCVKKSRRRRGGSHQRKRQQGTQKADNSGDGGAPHHHQMQKRSDQPAPPKLSSLTTSQLQRSDDRLTVAEISGRNSSSYNAGAASQLNQVKNSSGLGRNIVGVGEAAEGDEYEWETASEKEPKEAMRSCHNNADSSIKSRSLRQHNKWVSFFAPLDLD